MARPDFAAAQSKPRVHRDISRREQELRTAAEVGAERHVPIGLSLKVSSKKRARRKNRGSLVEGDGAGVLPNRYFQQAIKFTASTHAAQKIPLFP